MNLALALSVLCFACPISAVAQPVTGPYVSLDRGASIENPSTWNTSNQPSRSADTGSYKPLDPSTTSSFESGSIGYGFGSGFRVELGSGYSNSPATK